MCIMEKNDSLYCIDLDFKFQYDFWIALNFSVEFVMQLMMLFTFLSVRCLPSYIPKHEKESKAHGRLFTWILPCIALFDSLHVPIE